MGLLKMGEDHMVDIDELWISTVPELRELLLRDNGNRKDGPGRYKRKAQRDITYIWLMYDFSSDIRELPEEDRLKEACRRTDRQPWQVEQDQVLMDAIRAYVEILETQSSAYITWRRLKTANEKTLSFLENVDLHAVTEKGAVMWRAKEISDSIRAQPAVEKALDEIRNLAERQLSGKVGVRGDAELGIEEDPSFG